MKDNDQPTPKPQLSSAPPNPPRGPTTVTDACGGDGATWNPVAEEKTWREELEMMRAGTEAIERKADLITNGFYIACVGGRDAATHFVQPEYFVSRAAFLAELRRLMMEPTTPSRRVPSIAEYQRSQRHWLERIVKRYEPAS